MGMAHIRNESFAAQRTFQFIKTSEIQHNIARMAWLSDGGLVLMQMVKYLLEFHYRII